MNRRHVSIADHLATMMRTTWLAVAIGLLGCLSAETAAQSPAPGPLPGSWRFHELRAFDGVPLNVVEAGNPRGTAIVLLHGFTQSYLSWQHQLTDPELAARYRLVALDLRGHGASGKPWKATAYAGHRPWARDVAVVIDALDLHQPWIVGWSFGGYVAMDYVREFGQQKVAGLVFTGSHGGLMPRPPGATQTITNDLGLLIDNAHVFMGLMTAQPLDAAARERGEFAFVMLPPYVRRAMAGKRLDNSDMLDRLRKPLLMILGERDVTLPPEAIRDGLRRNPSIEVRAYESIGHSAFAEAPARFNRDLIQFVERERQQVAAATR